MAIRDVASRNEARRELKRREESFETWVETLRNVETDRDALRAALVSLADAAERFSHRHPCTGFCTGQCTALKAAIEAALALISKGPAAL